jgi:hypothetical protein
VFVCLFSAEPFVRQVRAELNRESEQRKSAASAGMLRPFLLVVRTYSTIRLPRILYPHESPLPERLCTPPHA